MKTASVIIYVICLLFLLYLMNATLYKGSIAADIANHNSLAFIWMTVFGLLIGILTEWKALLRIIQGHIRINWILFVPAIILMCICFIPMPNWVIWFGLGQPFYIDMLWKPEIHMILTVLSGILITRSIGEE